MNASVDRKPNLLLKLLGIAALAGLGAATGYILANTADLGALPWDDALALLMGVSLIAIGVISIGVMFTRPSSVPKGCGVLQITAMLLAGTMLLAPMFATDWLSPDMVFAGVVVLLVIQSAANLMLWRAADEMLRRVMWETSAMAFWALQLALFVYAAAERLGLIEGVSAWGMTGVMMGVYLIASMIASARRGIK
jgi:hypothetical protein